MQPAPMLEGHPLPTNNGVVAGVAAVVAAAGLLEAAIARARPGNRSRSRARHDLSASLVHRSGSGVHQDGNVETPQPDSPGEPPHPGPPPQRGKVIRQFRGGAAAAAEVEAVARDRTVRRLVAARRVAGRRQADTPERPNSPE